MKLWRLDGAELFSSRADEGSVVLGVLEESVVSLSDSGRVRISGPVDATRPVEAPLENSQKFTLVNSVISPERGKVFVVTREGFLHQVRQSNTSPSDDTSIIIILFFLSADFHDGETHDCRVSSGSISTVCY